MITHLNCQLIFSHAQYLSKRSKAGEDYTYIYTYIYRSFRFAANQYIYKLTTF